MSWVFSKTTFFDKKKKKKVTLPACWADAREQTRSDFRENSFLHSGDDDDDVYTRDLRRYIEIF